MPNIGARHHVDLETLYRLIRWPSAPGEPGARERFQRLRAAVPRLLEDLGLANILSMDNIRVLDLMAGGCVGGAALSAAFAERGKTVKLLCVDRRSVVEESHSWLEAITPEARARIEIEARRGDVTRLPQILKEEETWDIALVWGSSLPHLSPYELLLMLAELREVQPSHGVVLIEQNNLAPRLIAGKSFREVYVNGHTLYIYKEWDHKNGTAVRLVYELPGLKYLGDDKVKFWDVADAAAQVAVFYKVLRMHEFLDYARVWVIAGVYPRASAPAWRELAETVGGPA